MSDNHCCEILGEGGALATLQSFEKRVGQPMRGVTCYSVLVENDFLGLFFFF